MFSLNENNHYLLYTCDTDMRKLTGVIKSVSTLCPPDGNVYVFVNKTRTTMKLLHWERDGFVIYHKRLENGRISHTIFKSEETFRVIR